MLQLFGAGSHSAADYNQDRLELGYFREVLVGERQSGAAGRLDQYPLVIQEAPAGGYSGPVGHDQAADGMLFRQIESPLADLFSPQRSGKAADPIQHNPVSEADGLAKRVGAFGFYGNHWHT